MSIADLIRAVESIAPPSLAEPWDNVGLILGDRSAALRGPAMLTIDLTDAVASEAIEHNAGAIVCYHPPIFTPIKRLTADSARGRVLLRVLDAGIAVYSAHTALDAAAGGVTDWLMSAIAGVEFNASGGALGAKTPRTQSGPRWHGASFPPLAPHEAVDAEQALKLVTFVPEEHAERVRDALAHAGAGRIGAYEMCSFAIPGTGSFRGGAGTNPAVGQAGRLEFVSEVRLEMVCSRGALAGAIAALRRVHPYEEPAFEVYALQARPDASRGGGRLADLAAPTAIDELARRVKQATGSALVSAATTQANQVVRRVACVPGSGGSLLDAAAARGAECFVTGEMKHHEVLGALDRGVSVILAGHTETERGYLPHFAARLKEALPNAELLVSSSDRAPLRAV